MTNKINRSHLGGNREQPAQIVDEAEIKSKVPVAIISPHHPTAANRGRAQEVGYGGDESGEVDLHQVFAGIGQQGPRTGDVDANDPPQIIADRNAGDLHIECEIEGLQGDRRDLLKPVYFSDRFKTARDPRAFQVGWISHPISTTKARVALWDAHMLSQLAMTRVTMDLGMIALDGTDTTKTLLKWPMPWRARLSEVEAYYVEDAAGEDAAATLTFRRDPLGAGSGHVAVTGGDIALATGSGNVEGSVVAGDPITDNNRLHEGDRLEGQLAITDAGTFTGGLVVVRGTFELEIGT